MANAIWHFLASLHVCIFAKAAFNTPYILLIIMIEVTAILSDMINHMEKIIVLS